MGRSLVFMVLNVVLPTVPEPTESLKEGRQGTQTVTTERRIFGGASGCHCG